ncbi:MAG: GAF domain-containing protein, partial [Burkholderiaceae bacterium]
PEFRALLPGAPEPVALGPAEAENRFLRTLRLCVGALATEGQPQTLFLDDLQWADRASRRLLREWVGGGGPRHTLIVIAYRDNEIGPGHPLAQELLEFRELGARFLPLTMGPLASADTAQLLADSLQRAPAELAELAALCQAKTAGNPFFLRRFLEDLVQRGLVFFDAQAQRWDWSLARIAQTRMAENVVALMVEQLRPLPADCRRALTVAAFLGASFDLLSLAAALDQSPPVVAALLLPALQAQLLVPASRLYRYAPQLPEQAPERSPAPAAGEVRYAFAHDRVQEAAYQLVAAEERAGLHLSIGRLLRSQYRAHGADQPPAALPFDVVNHLNAAAALITDAAECLALAEANEQASQQAMQAAAFELAADYAEQAIALHLRCGALPPPAGPARLGLHLHAARMAYLAGRSDRMDALLSAAQAHAPGASEQARLLEVRIEASYAQGRPAETVELGLHALNLLGAELPQAATPAELVALIAAARQEIDALGLSELAALPPMRDEHILLLISISAKMTAAAYIARPQLLPLLTVFQVRLMVGHGHVPPALSAYSVLGLLCAEFLGDYRFAYSLGRMSLALVEKQGWLQVYAHAGFSFNAFLAHWILPLQDSLPGLMATHRNGIEFGNLRHAGLGLYVHDCHAFLAGQPLPALAQSLAEHEAQLRRMRQPVAADYDSALRGLIAALTAPTLPEQLDDAALAATYAQRQDQTGLFFLHGWRALLHFLAERHAPALAEARAARALFAAARGMHLRPLIVFIEALAGLRLGRDEAALAAADQALEELARWNSAGPGTFGAKQRLLAAALANARGQDPLPGAAAACGCAATPLDAALAQRERARWLAERHDEAGARAALAQARLQLLQWGAIGAAHAMPLPPPSRDSLPMALGRGGDAADLSSLMKAVQALMAEPDLPRLLSRLAQLVAENAGAQRAAIVLASGAQVQARPPGPADAPRWLLQAEVRLLGAPQSTVLEQLPLDEAGDRLPLGLLRRTLATGATLLLDDVRSDADALAEPYFFGAAARSALSVALVKQGRTVGALYLENGFAAGVFTRRRIEFLELLSAQVVNAVDNARLVAELQELTASLERRVEQRTRELRLSEERLSTILDNAPMPMTLTRRSDVMLIYANEPAARTVNMPVDELVGKPARAFYRNPEERQEILAKYQGQGLLNGEEVCLVAADGADRWVLLS